MSARIPATLLGIALAGFAGTAIAAQEVDLGQQEFMAKCAICHGKTGQGDGLELLIKTPADLTVLKRNNGGIFPLAKVYEVIDGRDELRVHGTRDMPIWGREYSVEAADYYIDSFDYDSSQYVRTRILALIDFVYRIQK